MLCWSIPARPRPDLSLPSCRGATAIFKTILLRMDGLPPSTEPCCAPCWCAKKANQLHLLSVVSPEWIGAGKEISVSQAPTNFGSIAFTLDQPSADKAVLHLKHAFSRPPEEIVVHLPWFVNMNSATADGRPIKPLTARSLFLQIQGRFVSIGL